MPLEKRAASPFLHPFLHPLATGFTDNPKYQNGVRLLTLIGAATVSIQQAHAMWTFDVEDPDFQNLVSEARRIQGLTAGEKRNEVKLWLALNVNPFIAKNFPTVPDAARGIGILAAIDYVDQVK